MALVKALGRVRLEDALRIISAGEKVAHEIGQPMNMETSSHTFE
jgi:hypothetical protein